MLGSCCASYYSDGTNNNAGDAQKEIRDTFRKVTDALAFSSLLGDEINSLLHENGVLRRCISFGGPYHITNLCVTWASIFAFGDTEKEDQKRVHHH